MLRPVLAIALLTAAVAAAQQPKSTLPTPKPVPKLPELPPPSEAPLGGGQVVSRYTLGEALAIGLSKHPQLEAFRASMNASLSSAEGLGQVDRMAGFITPDIEFRKQQSDIGLKAALAEYEQGQHDVAYAIIRCYYTVVYAREQAKLARNLVEEIETAYDQAKRIVEGKGLGVKGLNNITVTTIGTLLAGVRERLVMAETGVKSARAALREAMGVDPAYRVDAADETLPEITAKIDADTVIAHAVTRRGEVKLTQMGVDVTRLEACAQWSKRFNIRSTTYASGADIHARPVPLPEREPNYKPGAIGPSMPQTLVGKRETRTATANIYADRAKAAAEQARSLVAVEADLGFNRWEQAVRNIAIYKRGSEDARRMIEMQRQAAGAESNRREELQNEAAATQVYAKLNEALYENIIALANLERITAGGIRINFPGRDGR